MSAGVPRLMTDRDVAELLGCSTAYIRRRLSGAVKTRPGEIDIRKANPAMIGRRRVWLEEDVARVLRGKI